MDVFFKRRKISIYVKKTNFFTRGIGLTFRTKNTRNLLFDFNKEVTWQGKLTALFVFFPFLVLWLDDKNRIIDFRIVRPFEFSISQKKRFCKIIEIPLNKRNFSVLRRFVGSKKLSTYFRR